MKITSILSSIPPTEPYYTFEFFPPKTTQGFENLYYRLERMSHLNPAWIHITWGAGGSTADKSLELARIIKEEWKIEVCLHLTCTNIEKGKLGDTLEKIKQAGIRNILALRGDPPRGEESWVASDPEFQHASDLVRYIKRHYEEYFCIGVAGYSEGHCEAESADQDIQYLVEKCNLGADFVVTQLFYDVNGFLDWVKLCRERGLTQPILPGIMPIQNYQSFRRVVKLSKIKVPDSVSESLKPICHDDSSVKDFGVKLAVDMVKKLNENGINGFHFCTLNLERSVRRVLEDLEWVHQPTNGEKEAAGDVNKAIVTSAPAIPTKHAVNGANGVKPSVLSSTGQTLSVTPAQATNISLSPAIKTQKVEDPRQDAKTTWDDFPNGRWGDARSPAYGEIDGWGVSLKMSRPEALIQWGYPTTLSEISQVFLRFLGGQISSIPWSDEALHSETSTIYPHLSALISQKNWWTVGSQPAVDGVPSDHPTFGFGPKGGYIYQKAFVEFFLTEPELSEIERRIQEDNEYNIKFFAGNRQGEFRTNLQEDEVNVVTWGVFGGKEIASTTMIEAMSFKAWSEEAFDLWREWELLYSVTSPSRQLLKEMGETRWLISICHHDFKKENGLWDFLLK